MANPEKPGLIEQYTTFNLPGGEILRFSSSQIDHVAHFSHPDAILVPGITSDPLSRGREYGILRGLAGDRGTIRDTHHLYEIGLAGWVNGSPVSCVADFDITILHALSLAGHAVHTKNYLGKLIYDLNASSSGDTAYGRLVNQVKEKWAMGVKVPLPVENWTPVPRDEVRDHGGLLALLGDDGLEGVMRDLSSLRRITHIQYGSLIAQNLMDAKVMPDSNLVIASPTVASTAGFDVGACSLFTVNLRALSVRVIRSRRSTTGTG